jgi:glycosyltransferase involved in cell wall biosynthesis
MTHKISFIVPTMDREKDLCVMLDSLESQTRLPDQVIIVDGGNVKVDFIIDKFPDLNIDYVRLYPPSLSKQKNAGVKAVNDDITLVGYLDDDLELYPDAIEKMLFFWSTASNEYAAAAFAVPTCERKVGLLRKFFGLDSDTIGKVLSNGFVATLDNPQETVEVDWLYGGATVWRREILNEYQYDEWFQGSGYMEDIDFSYNVGGKYRLILLSEARTEHHFHPILKRKYYLLGKWQIVNRLYFVRKHANRGLSIHSAWLASFSISFINFIVGILRIDYNRIRMALGNIAGILIAIRGKDIQIYGHLKSK